MKDTPKSGLSAEERAAIQEYAREKRAAGRGPRAARTDGEADVLAKIATMSGADREMAERIHAIVKAAAPQLEPRTWYGSPAYSKDGQVLCFFQESSKFKTRYANLGFSDKAHLDEGTMWPIAYALKQLTPADEARISALVKKAVS